MIKFMHSDDRVHASCYNKECLCRLFITSIHIVWFDTVWSQTLVHMVDDTLFIISCWVISIAVLMFLGRTLQPISSSNFTISFHNSYYSSHDPFVAFDQKVELNSLDKLISQ